MFYEGYKKTYDFTRDRNILAFGDDVKNGDITIDTANDEQNNSAQEIREFINSTKAIKIMQ